MVLPLVASADESGSCGDNVTYTYVEATNTLTISGTGAMTNYSYYSRVPWYSFGSSIKTAIIENGVTSIGEDAFNSCYNLTSVTIGNSVMCIGDGAFWGCGLTSIIIPNSVTSIGKNAFSGCLRLTSIIIPNSVTSIGDWAFQSCSGLTTITIPNSITSIGNAAFSSCTGLTSITIPNSVTSIEDRTFQGCTGLTFVTIPNSVTCIGDRAFYGCIDLTSVTIPNFVTSIGDEAFASCSRLTTITIPTSVTNIGTDAFSNTGWYDNQLKGLLYLDNWLLGYIGAKPEGEVVINGGTRGIGDNAFYGCKGLTSVTIPNSVTNIGQEAFSGCNGLTSVTIPNSVTSIGGCAFEGCSSLTSVTIPNSVTSIGDGAFVGCCGLTSVNVESGNTDYDSRENCNAIIHTETNVLLAGCKNTVIPNSVTSIGIFAFSDCIGLTSINIPNSVTSIGEDAFIWCSSLTSVNIPNSVTSIGDWAFFGCSGLTSVIIPNSVTSIGAEAFLNCSSLTSVTVENPVPVSITDNTFSNRTNAILYVPAGSISEYEKAPYWKEFKKIMAITKNEQTLDLTEIPEKTYGDATFTLPDKTNEGKTLTWTVDNANVATVNSNVLSIIGAGTTIVTATQAGDDDYNSFTREYTLTVNKSPLTVTANSYTIKQGEALPTFEATYSGFKNGETASVLTTQPSFNCSATSTSEPGTYDIEVSGAEATNYDISYVKGTLTIEPNTFTLTYLVNDEVYRTYDIEFGANIIPESEPTKEGYTFSGWSSIPNTMPSEDVTVTGTFTVNYYKLTYMVDGEVYKTGEVEFGTRVPPEDEPTKEGYTFSGWDGLPSSMPAEDVTITGTFTINQYELIYQVNGETYKTVSYDYGESITVEAEPTKEGYTFSGWSEIPSTMPSEDVTVTGSFTINQYDLTYMVDGKTYDVVSYLYGESITPKEEPTKEGYTFSGWSKIPSTMPAEDVAVTGSFTVNKYKLTYMIDGKVYKEVEVAYGATITPEPQPAGDYVSFSWTGLPEVMPAKDVTVQADYVTGINGAALNDKGQMINDKWYDLNGRRITKPKKGVNILRNSNGRAKVVVIK